MTSCKVTFELSQEQKDAILQFINFNDWDINITETANDLEDDNGTAQPEQNSDQPELNGVYPDQRHHDGRAECSDCFCAPCITHEDNRQMWWPDSNEDAKHANASQRKRLYQRFWAMLYNCGAWQDPRYMRKKLDKSRKHSFTWHKRELMPECVLRQCRDWLPNPKDIPYMGHKWK